MHITHGMSCHSVGSSAAKNLTVSQMSKAERVLALRCISWCELSSQSEALRKYRYSVQGGQRPLNTTPCYGLAGETKEAIVKIHR